MSDTTLLSLEPAGGVEALADLVRNLPPDLPAAIFVVLHIPAHSTSVLPKIQNRCVQKLWVRL